MKRSCYFIPTLKEKPSDANIASQEYMCRGGYIKKVANGFFVYLPLMNRVMAKVNAKIRSAMESANSVEVKFPILIAKDSLEASGRWNAFGSEMFKLVDRHGNDFAISPTNEEAACFVADTYVKSYQDLPLSIYQIQQKHRDEISPRNGVMRTREFMMKDAYSFHSTDASLDEYYDVMNETYIKLFNSLGLDVVAVKADSGAMGGSGSQEIMAISADGETDICYCGKCKFAANAETVACSKPIGEPNTDEGGRFKKVYTPNIGTIDKLVKFVKRDIKDLCKAVIFSADGEIVITMVRGDREVNDVKLKNLLKCENLEMADAGDIVKTGKTVPGFVGAINLDGIKVIADHEVAYMKDMILGANEKDYHFIDGNPSDFSPVEYADIRFASVGEVCPICGEPLEFAKATELGHIFKLGKRYTDKLNLQFVNSNGGFETMTMGCYGIGVERTIASIIDQVFLAYKAAWVLAKSPNFIFKWVWVAD